MLSARWAYHIHCYLTDNAHCHILIHLFPFAFQLPVMITQLCIKFSNDEQAGKLTDLVLGTPQL